MFRYGDEDCHEQNLSDYPPEFLTTVSSARKQFIVYVLCVSCFVMATETTMLAVVIPSVSEALESTLASSFALGTTYLLTSAIFQPIISEISHAIGRRSAFIISLAIYATGSIIAATSTSMKTLLIARTIQGAGGAGEAVLPSVILTDTFYLRERSQYMIFLNTSAAMGSICGPIIGGALLSTSWEWIFWTQTALGSCCLVAVFMIPDTRPNGATITIKSLGKVDWVGILLTITTFVLCLIPLVLAGSVYAWSDWRIILFFCLGYLLEMPLLIYHQRFCTDEPMFRTGVFCNFVSITGFIASFVQGLLLFMILYYGGLYYEVGRGLRPVQVGLMALPATLSMIGAIIIAGCIIRRMGTYGWANRLGWAFTTLGFGLLVLLNRHSSAIEMILITFLPGIGLGLSLPGISMTIQRAIHPDNKAHATTMCLLMRSMGQCVGVAIGGTIFSNSIKSGLNNIHNPGDISIDQLYHFIDASRLDDNKVGPALEVVTESLRHVWIFGCVLAGLMLLVLAPIRYKPLPDVPR